MSKEATKKFIENNGFICNKCAKVVVDGTKHKNEEDLCDQCKIADLEAKLAEKESEIKVGEFWHSAYQGKQLDYDKVYAELRQSYDENEKLKQQLAEKEKLIENLRIDLKDWQDLEEKLGTKYDKVVEQLAEKDEQINMLEEHKFYADNIIQSYANKCKNHNQDKISFCIEKLKSIRNELSNLIALRTNETFLIDGKKFRDYINNEIELTKKENKNV